MRERNVTPTGVERFFPEDEIIVSKTDLKGHIIYANETFLTIADFTESEVLGQPHNIIRHPDMPRCIFKLLWDTIRSGHEIFAYVMNMGRTGDHYWVLAHVTPTFSDRGQIIGYHSNRRVPGRAQVELFSEVYGQLLEVERKQNNPRSAMEASVSALQSMIAAKGMDYPSFVFSSLT